MDLTVRSSCLRCYNCSREVTREQCRTRPKESDINMDINRRQSIRNFRISKHVYKMYIVMLVCVFVTCANGFNLDTDTVVEFGGLPAGSYFGYTAAMVNYERHNWLLFGAPRANSTFLPSVTNPGAIMKCTVDWTDYTTSCEELFVDDKTGDDGARFDGEFKTFTHGHTNQWLGVSLDVQPTTGVVTCASRWYNKRIEDHYFMNGMCYELPLDFSRNNIQKIPAFIDKSKQTFGKDEEADYFYAFGSLGMSAHYTEEGQDLLMGAPGLLVWTGGFVERRRTNNYITEYQPMKATKDSEMLGYAITSGDFFGNGLTYFAVGAPRGELTGKVYLYRGNRESFVVQNADLIIDGTEGSLKDMPINSFFGSSLCACDVNKDGKQDLLVAAPFYANPNVKDFAEDDGIVLVYLGVRDLVFNTMQEPLIGSGATKARFGSAMSCLGDINMDGYNDVVIGAPYEDNMQGAIYIYNGCKTGLWPKYSQRIPAADIASGLTSFGISFSRPVDMNDDGVNDVAVGAYLSDKAYLMFGKTVINIDITMETEVDAIDIGTTQTCPSFDGKTNMPCFNVKTCLKYNNFDHQYIDIIMTTELDVYMGNLYRLEFIEGGSNEKRAPFRIFHSDNNCLSQKVFVRSTTDLVTPVLMKASFVVTRIAGQGTGIKPTLNSFSGDNPTVDLLVAKKLLEFKRDCPNNECNTDLHLDTEAVYDDTDGMFVLGTPTISLDIKISKTGDPSYSSTVFVSFPKALNFQKVQKHSGATDITCGYITNDEEENEETDSVLDLDKQRLPDMSEKENIIVCSYGNPLYNDTGVSFSVVIVVPDTVTDTELNFLLNTTTLSNEMNPSDNVRSVMVGVRNKVTTSLIGVSRPSSLRIDDTGAEYGMTHTYELRNRGPSALPSASLTIRYPQVQIGGNPLLYLNKTTWSCLPPCKISCSFTEAEGSAPVVYSEEVGPTYYVNESPSSENIGASRQLKETRAINCLKSTCTGYLCSLTNIPPRESAVVTLEFVMAGTLLVDAEDGDAVTATSDGHVRLKDTSKLITATTSHTTNVPTQILPLTPPVQKLAWWIILLSVLGGILFIFLIILLLCKCGFFRRKEREAMREMQHTGEVQKMMPDDA